MATTAHTDIATMEAPAAPDLLASAKMVVEACNPLPLNAKQHVAFAYLTNAICRAEMEQAASHQMLAALQSAEVASMELCIGQDPANQCWVTLKEIRDAIAAAGGHVSLAARETA